MTNDNYISDTDKKFTNMIDELFNNTPIEQIKSEIESLYRENPNSPTIEEYLENTNNYISIESALPEPGVDVEYIDSDGHKGYAYLCKCCQKEWRCCITGSVKIINVKKWRYDV